MNTVFKIKAEIKVNNNGSRTWPIKTGYRPGFNFVNNKQTSGSIDLLNRIELKPGETGIVEISFISNELLGDIKSDNDFRFFEGPVEIGTGRVLEIIGWQDLEYTTKIEQ